jgi:hypothetical protein
LNGETIKSINGCEAGSDNIVFVTESGRTIHMFHMQDCCESVEVTQVDGDPQDLVGHVVVSAEEVDNDAPPPDDKYIDSYTWTFYKLATHGGYVTIRWLGQSNGYYSEGVDVLEVTP